MKKQNSKTFPHRPGRWGTGGWNDTLTNKHRDDIDGLRGVSILLVVLYHLGLNTFAGGYVGVDVFFVISGYVITNLIKTQVHAGEFNLLEFYKRRMRRLLPALLATLFLTATFAYFILSPAHFERMSGALLAAVFAVSNFYFIGEVGYFDVSGSFKPLLHTWSLAVEEQFYLVWPATLLMVLAARTTMVRRAIIFLIFAVVLASLISSLIFAGSVSSFFFTPFRIYEFFFGIALVFLNSNRLANTHQEFVFLAGMSLIVSSAIFYDPAVAHAAFYSFVAAAGAALLILSNNPRRLGYLLRNRIAVFIGKLSYSMYLIHWPVFVLVSYYYFKPIAHHAALAVIISFGLSLLLHYAVERPFRWQTTALLYRKFYTIIPVFTVMLIAVSVHAYSNDGWPWRFEESEFRSVQFDVAESRRMSEEYLSRHNINDVAVWRNGKKNILVLGDSHSINVFNALHLTDNNASRFNFRREIFTEECFSNKLEPPSRVLRLLIAMGVRGAGPHTARECEESKAKIQNGYFAKNADLIILANDVPDANIGRIPEYLTFVSGLSDAKIVFFGTNYLPYDPPTMLLLKPQPENINSYMYDMDRSKHLANNRMLKSLVDDKGIAYFDYYSMMCPPVRRQCIIMDSGKRLFDDDNHWSVAGEKYYGRILTDAGILSGIQ